MNNIRIEGRTREEIRETAEQMGVTIRRIYAKRKGGVGFFGYGVFQVEAGVQRIAVTQKQIDEIAQLGIEHAVMSKFVDAMYAERERQQQKERDEAIDVEFEVKS